ncbi:MAG: KH domain-containing protein [Firmicutes bacterium]|nr:KH domain-containing protein [Bacillota bacterium]
MEDLLKFIVENLADHPENIVITREGDDIKVAVPKAEMGKFIGKQGRIAKAIRTIVKASAKGERIRVDIVEVE